MVKFTPVYDPEKAKCEQNEEDFRKHRQFDTPHAQLAKDLNKPQLPKEDLRPMGRPTGELVLDADKLWRKKAEIFDKKKTWGRETVEYSNPEQARAESSGQRKRRPGDVGWVTHGSFGGGGEDNGLLVLQRGEVDQTMVRNEKGLWVPAKKKSRVEEAGAAVSGGTSSSSRPPTNEELLRAPRRGEDPRMEAAKPKGRDCADAAKRALEALEARRRKEHRMKEELGLTRRPMLDGQRKSDHGGGAVTLNSSSQQVRPQRRTRKMHRWQGVQRTDEEAREVIGKVEELNNIGKNLPSVKTLNTDTVSSPAAPKEPRSPSPLLFSRSPSPEGRSCSPKNAAAARQEPLANGDSDGDSGDAVVDFF